MFSSELVCGNCGWRTVCGRDNAIGRLRLIGLLRRDPDPDEEVLRELFTESAPRMTCPLCKETRLHAAEHDASAAEDDDFGWQAAVLCEICREPIDPERVEALPSTKRCVRCQGLDEAGVSFEEPDYCPRCGSLIEVRASRTSGITRYRRFCTGQPPCRL
jgi:RNA polymerase-binding transcription factor DksA